MSFITKIYYIPVSNLNTITLPSPSQKNIQQSERLSYSIYIFEYYISFCVVSLWKYTRILLRIGFLLFSTVFYKRLKWSEDEMWMYTPRLLQVHKKHVLVPNLAFARSFLQNAYIHTWIGYITKRIFTKRNGLFILLRRRWGYYNKFSHMI